ncbi:MAG: putative DNA-binding protein [Amycolatopsis sp.]|uniref:helix-turn-helix domain-containing protein n=1 Tax=Amycolatopsis sp. TaxID=37632 RepID=UPI00260E3A0A|nr:helix-turn-helix transcriptional regulator [Amycolatopsis sp.]MCU1680314.1 putative DNA-binding protein [Amycolatopsis sp.]
MAHKSPGVKAKALGTQLRVCREDAGLNMRDAAEAVDCDKSALSRLETGSRRVSVEEVALLLGVYRVRGALRDELLAAARSLDESGWWGWGQGLASLPKAMVTLAECESEARRVTNWAPMLVPGLLQTMYYARAWLLATGTDRERVEMLLAARATRQRILSTEGQEFIFFLGEPALFTSVGDAGVLATQLARIRELGERRNVSIRVLPAGAGPHEGQLGSFVVMEFPATGPLVLVELMRSSVFLDDEVQTQPYVAALSTLSTLALSEAESMRRITQVQAGLGLVSVPAG